VNVAVDPGSQRLDLDPELTHPILLVDFNGAAIGARGSVARCSSRLDERAVE